MGDIISAIYDDMDVYEGLCEHYGEEPQTCKNDQGHVLSDAYSPHCRALKKRYHEEQAEERRLKKLSIPTFERRGV